MTSAQVIADGLSELALRCEAAEAGKQYDLILLAWDTLNPKPSRDDEDACGERSYARRCFVSMLGLGAYESAAMALVPVGCHPLQLVIHGDGTCEADCWPLGANGEGHHVEVAAATTALAIAAAALRSRAAEISS